MWRWRLTQGGFEVIDHLIGGLFLARTGDVAVGAANIAEWNLKVPL